MVDIAGQGEEGRRGRRKEGARREREEGTDSGGKEMEWNKRKESE